MGNCANASTTPTLAQSGTTFQFHNVAAECSSSELERIEPLSVPEALTQWVRPENAHKNVRAQFQWHAEIAKGVTGSVHAVTYQNTDCAVKQVERRDQWAEKSFITEIRILSNLRHRGIIGFVDVFLDEKYFYLAMERADFDLHHLMKTSGPLDESKTKTITSALLESVAHLHSKNVVHRDLKPENIVFCGDDVMTPKLIDFGDAEWTEQNKSYTEFGTFLSMV